MTIKPFGLADVATLIEICHLRAFELDDAICIGDRASAVVNRAAFAGDLSGFEAFVNHVHLGDLWPEGSTSAQLSEIRRVADVVIASWAISLLPVLRGRSVLFFAGGTSIVDFTVRFHVERGVDDCWVDLADEAFLKAESIAVWRFTSGGLTPLHA